MADRRLFRMAHKEARRRAIEAVQQAPEGYFVEVKPPTRSLAQNARLHAMLDKVAKQKEWYGQYLEPEDWKRIFTALYEGVKVVPGIKTGTFVPIGMRTRDMTIPEVGDLMTLVEMFAAEHGLLLGDEAEAAA